MSALLDVMADAHTKSAGRQEPEQVWKHGDFGRRVFVFKGDNAGL